MDERRSGFLIFVVVAATAATVAMLLGLWQPIFWAIVLAVLLYPMQRHTTARLGGRKSAAAALVTVFALVFIIAPVLFIGGLIIQESLDLHGRITRGEFDAGAAIQPLRDLVPRVEEWARSIGLEIDELVDNLRTIALHAGQFTANLILGIGENAAALALRFFLALYLLFFLLKDGETIYAALRDAIPLPREQKALFFDRFAAVTVATLKGALVIGLVQGALGGFIFVLLGIPGAVFWGALMAILSAVPAIGPPLIWVPAAVILIIQGNVASGVILIAFGTLVIGMVDNLLRPPLVGRGTQMPDYLVLFSTLGGIGLFGISGIVLGPIVIAFFLTAWQIFGDHEG